MSPSPTDGAEGRASSASEATGPDREGGDPEGRDPEGRDPAAPVPEPRAERALPRRVRGANGTPPAPNGSGRPIPPDEETLDRLLGGLREI
jgi:hypothetical protein